MVHRGRGGGLMAKAKRTGRKKPTPRRRRRGSGAIEVALAGLAHEIRTPLTGILALAELLQAADLPERERRWAEAIRGAADHLARLTTLVVDAARADAAGLVLRAESFSPLELARAVAASLAARAEGKSLDVDVRIAKNLPARLLGDAVRLRSALENLIDNAVKFTERGRIGLSVSAARTGAGRTRLTFVVTDSGIGISSADLKRLFRPFAQANLDVSRRYGGAGLGLLFVKRIAETMGGGLAVTSSPGRGSTFRLSALVDNDTAPARQRGAKAVTPVRLRVLCTEDNPYGRAVLSTVLRELGHDVTFAASGEAAVETVARNGHDAVLMDIALSGIDGIEATRRIRALPAPAGQIPVVGVSGRTEPGDEAAALAAGMNAYLRKPASPAELHEVLQSVSRIRRV